MRTGFVLTAAVTLVLLLMPTEAGATTYCVHGPAGCPADGTVMATIQAALDDAYGHKGDDTVLIGPGDFTETAYQGFKDSGAVEIAGAGRGLTTLRDIDSVFLENPGSVLRDLSVRRTSGGIPNVWFGVHGQGTLRRVDVVVSGDADSYGVEAQGGPMTIEDSTIDASGVAQGEAVGSGPNPDTIVVRRSVLRGAADGRTVDASAALIVDRSEIRGGAPAILSCGPKTTVTDSLIVGGGLGTPAIDSHVSSCGSPPADTDLTVRGATVIDPATGGLGVYFEGGTASGTATVSNSYVRAEGAQIFLRSVTMPATLAVDHSDFDPAAVAVFGVPGSVIEQGGPTAGNRFSADPRFVDAAGGDYRLRSDSPLIDAGAGSVAPDALDLAGLPRLAGSAPDIGAYEYQRRAPSVSAQWLITPLGVFPGTSVQLTATATDPDPGESPALTWAFDDGGTASGASVTHAFATAGDHTATVTATDPAGLTATATVTVPVQAPLEPQQPPPPATPVPPAVTLPSALTARRGIVSVGVRCRAAAGSACTGTMTLSVPAGKGRYRTIAHARYTIRSGVTGAVKLKLSRSALSAVRHAGRRVLRLRATLTGGSTSTRSVHVTLRR